MTDPWGIITERLAERDKIEKRDSEYFQAFAHLSKLLALSGDASNDRLVKENAHLWEENESLIARLNLQTLRFENAETHEKDLVKTIKAQEAQVARLHKKISHLAQELEEKNKLFQIINDEHLISHIQQNVLKDKVEHLERELFAMKACKTARDSHDS